MIQPNFLGSSSPPKNNNKNSGVHMQGDVICRLVPNAVILTAQPVGPSQVILCTMECLTLPFTYDVVLLDSYAIAGRCSFSNMEKAVEFLHRSWSDAGREHDVWWRLICGRVREQVGGGGA